MNNNKTNSQSIILNIPNISCNHCVHTINMELSELEGVISVSADLDTLTAQVEFTAPATLQSITDLLNEIGYPPVQN